LFVIAYPSFTLIYFIDEVHSGLKLFIIGHQWYWSYEYPKLNLKTTEVIFDSYIMNEIDLIKGQFRLLETDNRFVLPVENFINLIITSEDVLHSWCVPAMGIKLDACPGRLNHVSLFISRVGTFYGQCSELCGIKHAFIPICLEAVPSDVFNRNYALELLFKKFAN
jgi:heme/copper-type cytochrome/quinol oxidase subunit 2